MELLLCQSRYARGTHTTCLGSQGGDPRRARVSLMGIFMWTCVRIQEVWGFQVGKQRLREFKLLAERQSC